MRKRMEVTRLDFTKSLDALGRVVARRRLAIRMDKSRAEFVKRTNDVQRAFLQMGVTASEAAENVAKMSSAITPKPLRAKRPTPTREIRWRRLSS